FFLGAHRPRLGSGWIEQPRLLLDPATVLDDGDLAARLVLDRLTDEVYRIEVLDLAARAEGVARPAYRHVDVGAQAALLHVAVAGAEIAQNHTHLRHEAHGVVERTQIRLGDNFHQRHARAIEV